MLQAAVGQAEGTDTRTVAQAVIAQCQSQLGEARPGAGLLFSAVHFDHGLALDLFTDAFPGIQLVGCSTGGELSSAMGFSQDSMCLMVFASDSVSFAGGVGQGLSLDSAAATRQALQSAAERLPGPPTLCLVFPGYREGGIATMLHAAHDMLGKACPVFGGVSGFDMSGDPGGCQFFQRGVHVDAVSVLLWAGDVHAESVICNSWEPVGYKGVVDETRGNSVLSISGRTALEFYRDILGPYATPLLEMPLAVFDRGDERFYLRTGFEHDEGEGSVAYETPIPRDCAVQLTEATPRAIASTLEENLRELRDHAREWRPQAALLFSCATRSMIMGSRTSAEIDIAMSVLPENMPIAGFYTFGEIGPLTGEKSSEFHCCSLVAVLLGEVHGEVRFTPHHARVQATAPDPELARRKLDRARLRLVSLEAQKEASANVQRRMGRDLLQAKRKIEEQNQILKESLTLAQEVQQNLLPDSAPAVEGFDIAGRSLYCDETGGDYIDYLPGEHGLGVVVGDVSGHGIAAALLMATTRALLRMRAGNQGSLAQSVVDLNRLLCLDVHGSGHFVTLFYLYLDPAERTVTWVRAGHEPAMRYSPRTGEFQKIQGEGLALGVLDEYEYTQYTTTPLEPGEIVLVVTDGVTETRDSRGELFGRDRLMGIVREHAAGSARDILDACLAAVSEFRAGLPREDDETLVVVKAV